MLDKIRKQRKVEQETTSTEASTSNHTVTLDAVLANNKRLDFEYYLPYRKAIISELMTRLQEPLIDNHDPAIWVYQNCPSQGNTVLSKLIDHHKLRLDDGDTRSRRVLEEKIKTAPLYYATVLRYSDQGGIVESQRFLELVHSKFIEYPENSTSDERNCFIRELPFLTETSKVLAQRLKESGRASSVISIVVEYFISAITKIIPHNEAKPLFTSKNNIKGTTQIAQGLLETINLLLEPYLYSQENETNSRFERIFDHLSTSFLVLIEQQQQNPPIKLISPLIEVFYQLILKRKQDSQKLESFFEKLSDLLERALNDEAQYKSSISQTLNRYYQGGNLLVLLAQQFEDLARQDFKIANLLLKMILTNLSILSSEPSFVDRTAPTPTAFDNLLQASLFLSGSSDNQTLQANLDKFWNSLSVYTPQHLSAPHLLVMTIVRMITTHPSQRLVDYIKLVIDKLSDADAETAFTFVTDQMNDFYKNEKLMDVLYYLILTKLNKKAALATQLDYNVKNPLLARLEADSTADKEELAGLPFLQP